MLTSSPGQGSAVSSSRIPVAKHRQNSPEHYNNHNYQQSQSHVSRLPKYQFSPTSQNEPTVTSSGGSSAGSGESESESTSSKRRKDSSGSISGLHGMPDNVPSGIEYKDRSASPRKLNDDKAYKPAQEGTIQSATVGDICNSESSETLSARKKSFEAFVMTGDRMINLAKTPANNEFKPTYHKTLEPIPLLDDESASVPSSPPQITSPIMEYMLPHESKGGKELVAEYSDHMDQSGSVSNVVKLRQQPPRNRSAVRTSKSEDQLMLLEGYQTSPDLDDCPGSVHTLLYDTSVTPIIDQPTNNFSSTPRKRSPPRHQPSSESTESSPEKAPQRQKMSSQHPYHHPQLNMTYTISPDISTSSLISASEHYNGGSLVNDNVCSPQTSNSSPDTPEWSLIDSFHKGGKNSNDSPTKKLLATNQELEESEYDGSNHDIKEIDSEDSINSKGNKVIITIGNKSTTSQAHDLALDNSDNVNLSKRILDNYNECERQPSWAPFSCSPGDTKAPGIESSVKNIDSKHKSTMSQPNEFQEEEDIDYPYATPYSPSQDTRTARNYPYVPPPVFATPSQPVLSSDNRTPNKVNDVSGSPLSICSEESESDLESIHSYHPPAKVIDIPSAKRLATRLYHLDGFKKTDVSRHLSRNNEYNQVVADEYLRFFEFSGRTLDSSLRLFLCHFCLTGETQERERVLLHFSKRYLECNPEVLITDQNPSAWFRSQDSVHTLTCAIMLLNTDLHGENLLQRKMTCNEFIENLSELNDSTDFPRDLLRNIYYAIKQEPIPWAAATEEDLGTLIPNELVPQSSGMGGQASGHLPGFTNSSSQQVSSRSNSELDQISSRSNGDQSNVPINTTADIEIGDNKGGVNPFLSLPDPASSTDYKKGYVMRKCCIDPNGKKTKLGKRSWKMFFLSLRDMVLYCFKEEKSLRLDGAFCDVNNAIRVHHGLAERASDYTKKQFVFRLHTADQAQYLFQTSDEKELLTWIDAINFVVASFSAPQLPAPCSSNFGRFQRPLMPSSKSNMNLSEQLVSHERQLMQLRREIEDHLQSPPMKSAKAAQHHSFKEKKDFLTFEIKRYETYILTLRTKSVLEDETNSRGVVYDNSYNQTY